MEIPANSRQEDVQNRLVNVLAGAIAGMGEHCVMYPVDTIKTRMQVITSMPRNSASGAFLDIIRKEGPSNLWRGITSVIIGAGPSHAIYFTTYETMKDLIVKKGTEGKSPFRVGIAGACATMFSDAFMNPFDVVKQRMQIKGSPYKSVFGCVSNIVRCEGIGSLYVSYPVTLFLNIPFQSIQFSVYEYCRSLLDRKLGDKFSVLENTLAGAAAGAAAASITTPLDVVRTVLQTRSRNTSITGVRSSILSIYRKYGISGFGRGMGPRVVIHMPSTAICWTMYEYSKSILNKAIT